MQVNIPYMDGMGFVITRPSNKELQAKKGPYKTQQLETPEKWWQSGGNWFSFLGTFCLKQGWSGRGTWMSQEVSKWLVSGL